MRNTVLILVVLGFAGPLVGADRVVVAGVSLERGMSLADVAKALPEPFKLDQMNQGNVSILDTNRRDPSSPRLCLVPTALP